MKTRPFPPMVIASIAVLALVGTSCAADPQPASVTAQDPAQWSAQVLPPAPEGGFSVSGTVDGEPSSEVVADVEPGWYELAVSCAGAENMTLDLRGSDTRFGTGYIPCQDTPITMVSYLGDNPYVPPEDISVVASRSSSPAVWGVSASPTEAPS